MCLQQVFPYITFKGQSKSGLLSFDSTNKKQAPNFLKIDMFFGWWCIYTHHREVMGGNCDQSLSSIMKMMVYYYIGGIHNLFW